MKSKIVMAPLFVRFIVSGASGAMGRGNKLQSKGDQIRAIVRLVKNETIYILVGQQGSAFCEINGVSGGIEVSHSIYYGHERSHSRRSATASAHFV